MVSHCTGDKRVSKVVAPHTRYTLVVVIWWVPSSPIGCPWWSLHTPFDQGPDSREPQTFSFSLHELRSVHYMMQTTLRVIVWDRRAVSQPNWSNTRRGLMKGKKEKIFNRACQTSTFQNIFLTFPETAFFMRCHTDELASVNILYVQKFRLLTFAIAESIDERI